MSSRPSVLFVCVKNGGKSQMAAGLMAQRPGDADLVITLGREAHVDEIEGTELENWDTDEPSKRGIEGMERMRLVRNDIARHVAQLHTRLTT